jgi:repressor LexA
MRPTAPSDPRPPRSTLTDRQRQVLDFIHRYLRRQGYAPSIREIGRALGIRSPNGVVCHLRVLAHKGLIRRHDRTDGRRSRARSITVPDRPQSGLSVDAVDEPVVLPVRDDSLAHRQILSGDYLLVRETLSDSCPSGTTLVLQRGESWMLHELQDGNGPTDGSIVGILVGVLRSVVCAPSNP